MTSQDLKNQLLTLSPEDKVELIQVLAQSLSGSWTGIQKTPGVVGGDACIGHTRIPVWGLESLRRQGANDATILAAYPQLTAVDLVNAWTYVDAHAEEIEAALRAEEEA